MDCQADPWKRVAARLSDAAAGLMLLLDLWGAAFAVHALLRRLRAQRRVARAEISRLLLL